MLEGGEVEIATGFPADFIGSILENLEAAAGERFKHTELYPEFAQIARDEGFEAAAMTWDNVLVAEKQHEKRQVQLADSIEADPVFNRDQKVVYRCLNWGYLHEDPKAQEMCPACGHPIAYFELFGKNWTILRK